MLKPSFHCPLMDQLADPGGFWKSAGNPDFCKRVHSEMRSAAFCGPSDTNGVVPAVTAPTVPGPGVRILEQWRTVVPKNSVWLQNFDFDVPGTEDRFRSYSMAIYRREQAAKVAL